MKLLKNRLFIAGALVVFASGCAGPKVISQISSSEDQVKFSYYQQKYMTSDQGIIQCDVPADGDLSNCKEIPLEFTE